METHTHTQTQKRRPGGRQAGAGAVKARRIRQQAAEQRAMGLQALRVVCSPSPEQLAALAKLKAEMLPRRDWSAACDCGSERPGNRCCYQP